MQGLKPCPKWTRLPLRTRPHRNPLAENDDSHPSCPEQFRKMCKDFFPNMSRQEVEFLDVGCAFGGMLLELSPLFSDTCMLGLEIRPKVVSFAQEKTTLLRKQAKDALSSTSSTSGSVKSPDYQNVWFSQLNVMKFGSNCFLKGQLSKIFFCYPDPHWKRKNIRRRIISPSLVHEYAYWLKPNGLLYTVSDVEELEAWMINTLNASPLFRRLTSEELATEEHQQILNIVVNSSEDAQRSERKGLKKHFAVHVRCN